MLVPEMGSKQVENFDYSKNYDQVQLVFIPSLICAVFNDTA